MFENVLVEQNPHWEAVLYPKGAPRKSLAKALKYLSAPHVISVTGVRRAGKSTLLKQMINFLIEHKKTPPHNILFVNLEHPHFAQYSSDVRFLEQLFEDYLRIASPKGKIFCFLDEIQFFAKWPLFIKAHYEQKNVKFILTGSNSFLMSHELLTLLSGRTLPLTIYPLSFTELIEAKTTIKTYTPLALSRHRHTLRNLLDSYLHYGGFPEVALHLQKSLAYEVLNAYCKTILYQDVAFRLKLKKPLDLERLFYYLSSNIGTPFSYSSLAKIFDLTDKTIKEYLEALTDAYLLFEVDKFSFSLKQQIRAAKKIYAIDTGMVNAIAFKFSENRGRLFENAVYLELKRQGKEIFYYKTQQDYEVDFVAKQGKDLELIQVCIEFDETVLERELRALTYAAKELKLKKATLITAEEHKDWKVDGLTISAVPLHTFILRQDK